MGREIKRKGGRERDRGGGKEGPTQWFSVEKESLYGFLYRDTLHLSRNEAADLAGAGLGCLGASSCRLRMTCLSPTQHPEQSTAPSILECSFNLYANAAQHGLC